MTNVFRAGLGIGDWIADLDMASRAAEIRCIDDA
jgi:hypothetical protein